MTKMNKMREDIIQNFVDCLKKDTIPWHKSWSSVGHPRNAVSEKSYQGLNFFWLEFVQSINGYEDPRWCTFKQATDAGWKIKKGSKGVHVEFWSLYDTEIRKKVSYADAKVIGNGMTDEEFKERFKPISNTYTVFNAEQIEGIPAYVEKIYQLNAEELLLRKDTLIKNMEVGFEEGGDRAYYTEVLDRITLPEVNRFESEYDYMATLLHEAAHATGHTSRLNRDMEGVFGSPKYAREELRAEIASAFTAQTIGIDYQQNQYMENHEAYVKSWIGVLQNDPNELFTAIKDAEKISDYLIEKGEFNKQLSMTNDDMHVKNKPELTPIQENLKRINDNVNHCAKIADNIDNQIYVATNEQMTVGKPPFKTVKIDMNADVGNLFATRVRDNGIRIKKTYNLPNVMNTLKKDYLAGKISIKEAARKMKQCNMTEDIVSNDRALKMMGLKEEIKNPQPQKNISR